MHYIFLACIYILIIIHIIKIGKFEHNIKISMKILREPKYNKKLNNVLYIIALIAILYCVLFYLDMINQLSLQNIVSMILGFLIMIIAQLRFISYYYQDKMKSYDLDEVGIVLDAIKNNVFGEINLNYITKKQKMKYYHHTKDQNDKLLADQNQEIFDCVMTVLRSKNDDYNDNRAKMLKQKWEAFIVKIGQFQALLSNIYKLNKERSTSYKQFHEKILLLTDSEYQKWQILFKKSQQMPHEYAKQLYNYNHQNWLELKKIYLQKSNNMQSMIKQTSQLLVNQFNAYAIQMRNQMRKVSADLQTSQNENASIKKQYRQIMDKIKTNNQKIQNQIKKIQTKTKASQNMEFIFNAQYNLRFLRVQLSNLQIKMAYIKDNVKKSSEMQYRFCVQNQSHLQQSGIKKINNKISHYLISYFDKIKSPLDKKKQPQKHETQQFKDFTPTPNTINTNQQQRRIMQFKSYITNLLALTEMQITNLKRINSIMKDYEKQWRIKSSQFKFVQDSIGDKIVDNMFIQFIEAVNKKQMDMLGRLVNILHQQQNQIEQVQFKNPEFKNAVSLNQQVLLRNKQQMNKKKGRQDMIQFSPSKITELGQLQNNKNKIKSYLPQIFICLVEGYNTISKQIEDKKQYIQSQTKKYVDNPRFLKMNQYKDQIFKIQREQFLKQEQSSTKKDQKALDESSLAFINRIVDVFFSQWRNSDFFHQILKQEIEISLNTKRPPILSYMNVKYIKLHQKQQKTIKNLNVLSDNVFICQFEAEIDFKGIIAVHIETKANNKKIDIQLVIRQFHCPIRICFTPFSLGKSNVTMMKTPKLSIEYSAKIDGWQLTKIPFVNLSQYQALDIYQNVYCSKAKEEISVPKKSNNKSSFGSKKRYFLSNQITRQLLKATIKTKKIKLKNVIKILFQLINRNYCIDIILDNYFQKLYKIIIVKWVSASVKEQMKDKKAKDHSKAISLPLQLRFQTIIWSLIKQKVKNLITQIQKQTQKNRPNHQKVQLKKISQFDHLNCQGILKHLNLNMRIDQMPTQRKNV